MLLSPLVGFSDYGIGEVLAYIELLKPKKHRMLYGKYEIQGVV